MSDMFDVKKLCHHCTQCSAEEMIPAIQNAVVLIGGLACHSNGHPAVVVCLLRRFGMFFFSSNYQGRCFVGST